MLKIKLFKAFTLLVVLFGIASAVVGVRTINEHVLGEAQTRVRLDIGSAWAVLDAREHELEMIVRLAAGKQALADACESGAWDEDLRSRLERIRASSNLDFLDVLGADGKVAMRTTPPFAVGDYRNNDPAVMGALRGDSKSCITVLSRGELEKEGDGLAERAYLEIEETPHARRTLKTEESRGLAMVAAAPVMKGPQLIGMVYGGVLLNRNTDVVDRIRDIVYRSETYKGMPVGTATIFLDDARVTTTVRGKNGNRAIGTRMSKEVADRVLDNGTAWVGEAFVVNEPYITAYEAIRDGADRIVGVLYVGVLKKPYVDTARGVMARFVLVSLAALAGSLVLAFIIAGRLASPIHKLVESSNRLSHGQRPPPVPAYHACHEIDTLIQSFNQMVQTLADRETRLKTLNRSYMETLGFVSHELKSPVATITNYAYLMRQLKLGPLTEKQQKAMKAVDDGSHRLVEMVRHYLNLSRIENGELTPVRMRVAVLEDVLQPLLDGVGAEVDGRRMKLVNEIGPDVAVNADLNMLREVFENLMSNAIKYGREGGTVALGATVAGDMVRFAVRNEGPGIPPERLGQLFQKFSRLDGAPGVRSQKGTGLGLFITKSIVEAHGGSIQARSEPDGWTEFSFTIPVARAEEATDGAGGLTGRGMALRSR